MAKIRNTAPDARFIPLAERVVESGDDFEVADDVFDQHEWPEELFKVLVLPESSKDSDVEKAKRSKAAKKAAATRKAKKDAKAAEAAAEAANNEDPSPDGSDDEPGSGEED